MFVTDNKVLGVLVFILVQQGLILFFNVSYMIPQ